MRYAPILVQASKLWRARIFATNSKPYSASGQGWRQLPKAGTVHSQRCTAHPMIGGLELMARPGDNANPVISVSNHFSKVVSFDCISTASTAKIVVGIGYIGLLGHVA